MTRQTILNTGHLRTTLKDVRALAAPYFRSTDKWRARALLLAIVALNLGAVYMLVLINDWNRLFYDALQDKNEPVFWQQLARIGWLAGGYIAKQLNATRHPYHDCPPVEPVSTQAICHLRHEVGRTPTLLFDTAHARCSAIA